MKKLTLPGFTIIEVLAALLVVLIVGSIIGATLYSSTRGSARTDSLSIVRQNGDYAISQMQKTIRNASALQNACPVPTLSASSISVVNFDGSITTFSCSANAIFSSNAPNVSVTPTPVSLIDQNTVTVPAGQCSFSCTNGSVNSYPSVGISFTLQKTNAAFFEQTAQLDFQSTVTLRNTVK